MPLQDFKLQDKVAIVTGASKGIGAAMATIFAEAGAKVVVSSRKQQAVDQVAQAITAAGGQAIAVQAHMGNADDIQNLVDATTKTYGTVDIVVNNAATNPVFGPVIQTDDNSFDKIMEVNVKGPFRLMRAVQPIMLANGGGSIINISSVGGLTPEPMLGIYSVSKASLISLSKVAAKEWGSAGIRVNTICPGLIKTKFSAALWQNDSILKHVTENLPINRAAEPEEVANLALFLASDASSYVTGSTYTVDGGHSI